MIENANLQLTSATSGDRWVQLHSGNPGDDGTDNVSLAAIGRQPITFGAPSGGSTVNTDSGSWGGADTDEVQTHFTLWDDDIAGAVKWIGPLYAEINAVEDVEIAFIPGDFVLGAS